MAFLVNLLAYPFFLGLLPYVAKDVYGDRAGRARLPRRVFLVGRARRLAGGRRRPLSAARRARHAVERRAVVRRDCWSSARPPALAVRHRAALRRRLRAELLPHAARRGHAALVRRAMRGRVMGVRMLAIWGLPLGLVGGRAAHRRLRLRGHHRCCMPALGLAATLAIGYRWRQALWNRSAVANAAYAG